MCLTTDSPEGYAAYRGYMKLKHRSGNFNFVNFIMASVLAHIAFICLIFLASHFEITKNKSNVVEISFVEPEIKKNIIVNPTAVVETDSADTNNELSEKAKFLSEKNNTVEKETKAQTGIKFQNAKKPTAQTKATEQKQPAKKAGPQIKKPQLFQDTFDAYSSLNKKAVNGQASLPASRSEESSTTNDNLAQIESDLMTRLNTKEYRYFGYYSRIKTQLNQWWVPKVQHQFTKMLRQGRTVASEENKVTKLVIILNETGRLVKVQVLAESGIKDLDDAAIEAFRSAAPFPNPPKGMIDDDGLVKIRWDCVVES